MNELGVDNFYIELYENYSCNSKEELNRSEGERIRAIGNLNHLIAGRTKEEYSKEYRESTETREKHLNEKKAQKYKGSLTEQTTCECGCIIQKCELPRHKKTKKHINLMSQKETKN